MRVVGTVLLIMGAIGVLFAEPEVNIKSGGWFLLRDVMKTMQDGNDVDSLRLPDMKSMDIDVLGSMYVCVHVKYENGWIMGTRMTFLTPAACVVLNDSLKGYNIGFDRFFIAYKNEKFCFKVGRIPLPNSGIFDLHYNPWNKNVVGDYFKVYKHVSGDGLWFGFKPMKNIEINPFILTKGELGNNSTEIDTVKTYGYDMLDFGLRISSGTNTFKIGPVILFGEEDLGASTGKIAYRKTVGPDFYLGLRGSKTNLQVAYTMYEVSDSNIVPVSDFVKSNGLLVKFRFVSPKVGPGSIHFGFEYGMYSRVPYYNDAFQDTAKVGLNTLYGFIAYKVSVGPSWLMTRFRYYNRSYSDEAYEGYDKFTILRPELIVGLSIK